MQTINLIGAGRVGQTLAHLWHTQNTFVIQDVLTTSLESAQRACHFIGSGTPAKSMATMRSADLWMLAVPDAQVASTAEALAKACAAGQPPAIVFHCSGALDATVLSPLAHQHWHTASAHCILSFASTSKAVSQFAGTACALEGSNTAKTVLRAAFNGIGARCFDVQGADKLLYHAAAVFATNFLPVLQQVAEDAWRTTGVPDELISQLRTQLLHNAVANITALGPQGALTGPAARKDTAAIARQAQAVSAWDTEAGAAYAALSALALRMAKSRNDCT